MRFLVPAWRLWNVNANDAPSACSVSNQRDTYAAYQNFSYRFRLNFPLGCVTGRGEKWEQPLGIARARPWNDPLGTDLLAKYGSRTALGAASSVMDGALIAPNGTFRIVFFFRSAGSAFLLLFRFTFSNFVLIYQTFGWCRAWTNKRKQNISRHEDDSIVSFESI